MTTPTELYFKLAGKAACFDALRWVRENNLRNFRSALLACEYPTWIDWACTRFANELGIPHEIRLRIYHLCREFSRQWYFGRDNVHVRQETLNTMRDLLLPYLTEETK